MDMELQAAVFEAINDLDPEHNLPQSELRKIAEDVIAEGKVTDGEWVYERVQDSKKDFARKRNIARIRGYAPFSSLNQRVYNKLIESFGDEVIEIMKNYLADPEDIYSKWSYRFAYTLNEIGIEACAKHKEQIYEFVTTHPKWEENMEKCSESYRDWISLPGDRPYGEKPQAEKTQAEQAEPEQAKTEQAETKPETEQAEAKQPEAAESQQA
ncbi:MAG: hypothetical protein HRU09_06445 [Oligoflexales bacterium]|nr:hypothetical protein [Oligoflexales bacterium]